jgi:hypothetical protein
MNGNASKSTGLKYFLIALNIIVLLLICGGLYLAQGQLREKANAIIVDNTQQSTSSGNSAKLVSSFNANRTIIDKAAALTTSGLDYQTRVKTDLDLYARSTGVSIKSIETDTSYSDPGTTELAGLQAKYVLVTFNNPTAYNGFIRFINSIETNLPKMQIMSLKIEGVIGAKGSITVDPITIKIYMGNSQ